MDSRHCIYCKAEITIGRVDKKYCNTHCRSAHQYKRDVLAEPFYHQVRKQLVTNRNVLKSYNRSGLAKTRLSELVKLGFNPKFSTHSWQNSKGEIYSFIYEFGFLVKEEKGVQKAILVKWQDYMT